MAITRRFLDGCLFCVKAPASLGRAKLNQGRENTTCSCRQSALLLILRQGAIAIQGDYEYLFSATIYLNKANNVLYHQQHMKNKLIAWLKTKSEKDIKYVKKNPEFDIFLAHPGMTAHDVVRLLAHPEDIIAVERSRSHDD